MPPPALVQPLDRRGRRADDFDRFGSGGTPGVAPPAIQQRAQPAHALLGGLYDEPLIRAADDDVGEAPRNSSFVTPTAGGTTMSAGSSGTENTEYGAIEMASAVFEVIVSLLC